MKTRRSLATRSLPRSAVLGALLIAACGPFAPPPRTTTPAPPVAAPPAVAAPAPEPAPVPTPAAPEPPLAEKPPPPAVPVAPLVSSPPLTAPAAIRVGLASDLPEIAFPCCDGEVTASVGDQVVALVSPIQITPASGARTTGVFRLQAAALKDESQAAELALRLAKMAGAPADSRFDAATDLYRVRVGRLATREEAEKLQSRLQARGVTGTWVVSEGAGIENAAFRVRQGTTTHTVEGRWLVVTGRSDGLRVQGKRYRGRILLYLNDRGTLNVVNELPLEWYLRGVVPVEMGPGVYDEIEALKAQAVAARTYTLRNLGEFASEGYDICATPRCQVYGGLDAEHPLSDRAVRETAGQVLTWEGAPADTLYTSTCGGHTEDVEVVFPLKHDPYLRGVPCQEGALVRLAGVAPPGEELAATLVRRLLPPPATTDPVAVLAARLEVLALRAGLAVPDDHLASLERREVQRYVGSMFDLALDARLFVADEDVAYLLASPPPNWSADDRRLAAYLVGRGFLGSNLQSPVSPAEIDALLFGLSRHLRLLREEEVQLDRIESGVLTVHSGDEHLEIPLPRDLATFRLLGPRPGSHADLQLERAVAGDRAGAGDLGMLPGDRLRLYWRPTPAHAAAIAAGASAAPETADRTAEELLAVVHQVAPEGAAHDRTSKWSSWTRFRSDREIAASVRTRFPGFDLASWEVVSRGGSGRVGRIRLHGRDGSTLDVDGLAVRWTLDVPETLFTAKRTTSNGQPGWLFNGRGWGHGVGLCQVGAYGMAQRGHTHAEILGHYYRGATLQTLAP